MSQNLFMNKYYRYLRDFTQFVFGTAGCIFNCNIDSRESEELGGARRRIARQLANKKTRRKGILRLPAQIITELFMSVGARSSAAVCAS